MGFRNIDSLSSRLKEHEFTTDHIDSLVNCNLLHGCHIVRKVRKNKKKRQKSGENGGFQKKSHEKSGNLI